ncbi:putative trans-sialidase, Group V [Trypanosoma cruzi]|uniref:Trans-sialidase, putative n=2 Tax=Trypanosoma cruzi TaxID=5693 RepID=Q4E424_TRYCC|nr:trans-sialidase, putative [Trypanosoma cruzi]EAN99546.1 trans-sialidase, putative [Trypanosoma cruzi]PWV09426.1 putative trans-sialidase, Group V [Trypanosoma cruzi]|eukprot:XP_821397.1 trans-sialidase [Trypanosoma cruzi strain CL Brener]
MLSRVAAVKAPRIHNRRRLTGSSGRRREGRESEPQRPNMSRHLFYSAVLLLVVMMCCNTGGAAEAPGQSSEPNYKWKNIKNEEGVTVESLGAPGLLKVGSDVFAVAEAQCKKSDANIFTGIASQLLTKDNAEKPMEVLNGAKDKTQVLEEDGSEDPKKRIDVSRPTTVMQGNDIYMLVGKYSQTAATGQEGGGADDWGLLLVQGNVSDEGGGEKRIQWNENQRLVGTFSADEHKRLTQLIGGGGSGIKTNDGTLVFPVEGTKKGEAPKEDKKTVSLIIYSKDAKSWKLSKGMSADGCSDPSVVEWKDKKLIMMTACDDGRRRVYESGDKGESWTEALGTLSRVWGNKKGEEAKAVRSGFITATIDGADNKRNVMLVTLPVYSEKADKKENGELHLWLTDNTHIVDIGPVSDDDAAASSLLYKSDGSGNNEELIALYEKKKGDGESSHSLWSVLLTEQLQRVKDVLATWKKVDDLVSKLCTTSSAEKDASPENACSPTVKITDGLVGFLSDNFSDNKWRDEYLGVNATVKKKDGATEDAGETGATKTSDGVIFQGAWAEWPVGKQGENQLYHFANYNFTLVATVSIDGVPEEGDTHIPLMGVKMDDSGKSVLLGLSYNSGGKWELSCGEETPKELSSTWEKDTTHQVVILLRNGTQGSVYVDGERVSGNEACELENKDSRAVSHFYIGGGERSAGGAGRQEEVSVTVRNVLLYNRPLSIAEIGALNPNKALIPPVVSDNAQGTQSQFSPAGQPPSGPKLLNENEGTGGGSTSTSAPSTVTTSLGKEQSAIQLPSGVSSGGNKNVDVASPSDGDPTVGAEAGGAVQGDTPPQTPVDTPDTADPNAPTATNVAQVDPADTTEVGARSGENGETVGGTDGQKREDIHAQDGEVKAAALSSSLGNVSLGNNSDAGTVRGSGLLPLFLLLGLWVFAAL